MLFHRIRGRLGSLLMLSVTIGILFGFVAGTYLTYFLVPKIFLPLPIIFFVAFFFFPETPQYFIARKNFEVNILFSFAHKNINFHVPLSIIFQRAKESLSFYRNCRCAELKNCPQIDAEFNEILRSVMEHSCQSKEYRKNMFQNICKLLLIGFNLHFLSISLRSVTCCSINLCGIFMHFFSYFS